MTGWLAMRTRDSIASPKTEPSVIPLPVETVMGEGTLTIGDGGALVCDAGDLQCTGVAHYLADLLKHSRGITLAVEADDTAHPPAGAIAFRRLSDPAETGKEGYRLDISPDGARISASETAGLFYGAVTLWQLLTQKPGEARSATLGALHISDSPRFAWRGILLDSARHYQSPEFVKSFIDAMALHKLNVLQWHLTDDQGWRLEIGKYPRLTSVGAWRVPAGAAAQADIDPATGKPRLYGGFYTQDQVRDIVRYAQDRNVAIVPEIEMPGHAEAAIVAYPQLGSVAQPPTAISSDWGVFPYLYNVDDSTFAFLENVLSETMALFPSAYIHIGGDEAVKDQWKASPKIQAQMHALGIANEDELQSYFVERIEKFLNAHGRKLIGWDEILQDGIAPNATITSWRGIDGAVTAAKLGHDAVLSPAPVLYLDNRQGDGPDEPPGRGHVTSLQDVYDFDPAPASLTEAERTHIIGVQANIWTEHIRNEEQVAYMTFPRAAAFAEMAWTPAGRRDWAGFLTRLVPQIDRYRELGIASAPSAFEVRIGAKPRPEGKAEITLSNQTGFGTIRYTLDGRAPTSASPRFEKPFTVRLPARLKTAAFLGDRVLEDPVARDLDPLTLRKRFSQELQLCSNNISLSLEDDAPLSGPRAVFLVDVMNPCWIYPKVDMTGISSIEVAVGQVPFNFQIGDDVGKIVLRPPSTPDGELEVHLDNCNGERIAVLPFQPAVGNDAVTSLSGSVAPRGGVHDLCFVFTRKTVDPIWAIDWVNFASKAARSP